MDSHDEKDGVRHEPVDRGAGNPATVPRSKAVGTAEEQSESTLEEQASENRGAPAESESGSKNGESSTVPLHEDTSAPKEDYDPEYGYRDAAPARPESAGTAVAAREQDAAKPVAASGAAPPPPPPPANETDGEDDEEEEMLRMSFMEHLEELRLRIIRSLMGVGVAFVLSLIFVDTLWSIVSAPAIRAMKEIGIADPKLVMLTPTESFSIIWIKLPILTAVFLASPWVLYQIWAFIAPGLYRRERRWAAPFVISSAALFILGGLFAYFVAFPLGLAFLLGIGLGNEVQPMVSIAYYFDLFVNVALGMGLVFELPVLIFFLALLRIVSPRFLVENSRYAILIIVVIAALITPTPDAINLMLISVPMGILYVLGVFAAYLLTLSREKRKFPWLILVMIFATILLLAAGTVYLAVAKYGFRLTSEWPFLVQ
jgi:sec-independent protein translocase protein TatC